MKGFTLIAYNQQFYLHVVVVKLTAAHDLLGVFVEFFLFNSMKDPELARPDTADPMTLNVYSAVDWLVVSNKVTVYKFLLTTQLSNYIYSK